MKLPVISALCASILLANTSFAEENNKTIGIAACCVIGQTQTMDTAAERWKEMAAKEGIKVIYENADEANNQDKTLQIKQMREMVDKGAKVIFVMLVQNKSDLTKEQDEFLKYAKEKGTTVIAYNREPGKALLGRNDNLYYVGSKALNGGIYHADMMKSLVEKNPDWDKNKNGVIEYVLFQGIEGSSNETSRTKGLTNTLNKNEKYKQIKTEKANWNHTKAKEITASYISSGEIDQFELIACNSDDMALGVLEAFKEAGKEPLPITSINALPEVQQKIKDGEIQGSVYQNITAQQDIAFKMALNVINDKPVDDGLENKHRIVNKIVNVPWEIVTKENVDKYLK
ncbi:MAG: substrate-binding domain-containing protein [Cardiobacteriaceae bacterium]|nr:substrate-binding domain-containing protein [Cardiobacteriaceae bacterium]